MNDNHIGGHGVDGRLEGLLLTKERIFLPNPPLEQSFDQLELLDEEKIGGETVVSLLKFLGSMVL